MKIYFDTEFTGLELPTTLISIGLVAEDGRYFYAELYDYNAADVDAWIQENVIENLKFNEFQTCLKQIDEAPNYSIEMKENQRGVFLELTYWLAKFDEVELISDGAIPHDNMLVKELFNNNIPSHVTLSNRNMITEIYNYVVKENDLDLIDEILAPYNARNHNCLEDAKAIKKCYERVD